MLVLLALGMPATASQGDAPPPTSGDEALEPLEPEAPRPDEPTMAADGLYVEFGRGVQLTDDDARFALTLRGRVQTRATARRSPDPDDPLDVLFQVRRARLVLLGDLPEHDLQLYVQVGLGASDLEPDYQVPLRDGVISWRPLRDASFRVGQMKVPFSRQRMVSSSALQLVDRSIVNAALNLDRDVGLQVYSNDLLGLNGVLSYQAGIYEGQGRNRVGSGSGLLYVARVQVQPLGGFQETLTEADLTRSTKPRLSVGAAAAANLQATRTHGTHGQLLTTAYDMYHATADIMFKWYGWSVQLEGIARRTHRVDPPPPPDEPVPLDGMGAMAQAGYLFANGVELAGRVATLGPLPDAERPMGRETRITGAVGRYLDGHDLKIQADYGVSRVEGFAAPGHEARVQLQFFF